MYLFSVYQIVLSSIHLLLDMNILLFFIFFFLFSPEVFMSAHSRHSCGRSEEGMKLHKRHIYTGGVCSRVCVPGRAAGTWRRRWARREVGDRGRRRVTRGPAMTIVAVKREGRFDGDDDGHHHDDDDDDDEGGGGGGEGGVDDGDDHDYGGGSGGSGGGALYTLYVCLYIHIYVYVLCFSRCLLNVCLYVCVSHTPQMRQG